MRIEIVILHVSILASSTDLKRIHTPHDLFRDFRADDSLQLISQEAEFKFESKPEPLLIMVTQVIWQIGVAITPAGFSTGH